MFTKYSCSICKTEPDQLSHHKSHLKTQKHKDNCDLFIRNMKIFSHLFRQISPYKWDKSPEKDYIQQKYIEMNKNKDQINSSDIKNWIVHQGTEGDYSYDSWDDKVNKIFKGCSRDEYYINTGIMIPLDFDIEIACDEELTEYIDYSNWAIDKIMKSKETITTKPNKKYNPNKLSMSRFKTILSKHTNVNFNLLNSVKKGEIDLNYLTEPIDEAYKTNLSIEQIALYEPAVKYACLLFNDTGIWQLSMIYDGHSLLDIEESPEEIYNQTFYFHKQVEIEHTTSIKDVINYGTTISEKKYIWVSCDMEKFCEMYVDYENFKNKPYNYLTTDDFKVIIKERLSTIYRNKLDKLNSSFDKKMEILDKKSKLIYFGNSENIEKGDFEYYKPEGEIADKLKDLSVKKNNLVKETNEKRYYYSNEINIIRDLLLGSKLLEDITKVCEFLFEYNEELIEYYKHNRPNIYRAIEIQRSKLRIKEEEFDELNK